jgi:hypothetical protein
MDDGKPSSLRGIDIRRATSLASLRPGWICRSPVRSAGVSHADATTFAGSVKSMLENGS